MLLISSRMTTVLPTPAPPNAPTLPPLVNGTDQIDDLDAGLKNRRARVLIGQLRRLAVNRITLRERNRAASIHRIARDVKHAAQASPRPPAPKSVRPCRSLDMPRFKPSVDDIAIERTQFSPRCCCTSSVSLVGVPLTSYSSSSAL